VGHLHVLRHHDLSIGDWALSDRVPRGRLKAARKIHRTIEIAGVESSRARAETVPNERAKTTVAVQPIVDRLSRIVSERLHLDALGRKALLQRRQSGSGFGEGPTLATDKGDTCCVTHRDFLGFSTRT